MRRRLLFSNRWGEGGIALANDLSPGDRHAAVVAAISGIDEVARGLGVDKAIVRWPALARRSLTSEGSEMGKFLAQGFRDRSNQALVVRLNDRSRAELWSALSSSCRGRVRHALKAGVVVTTPSRQDVMDRYYELHVETYRRTRARPHPRKYFDTILRSEWSKVFFAELNGQVVAALNLALFEGRAAYWTGASRDGAGKIGANNLLQWHAIEWLHSGGFIAYAIGETPPGDLSPQRDPKFHSLTRYKLTFAPTLLPYHRAEHVYRPVGESVVRLVRCLIAR